MMERWMDRKHQRRVPRRVRCGEAQSQQLFWALALRRVSWASGSTNDDLSQPVYELFWLPLPLGFKAFGVERWDEAIERPLTKWRMCALTDRGKNCAV
mmetsp:Transcript_64825/g.163280  ORF Transcript_64825/g.163280 Transcript_64825/m.163280 type:complete len:98 (-) Transcript_64825:120-413(-)